MCDDAQIRVQLSQRPDDSPEGMSRRRFLQYTAAGAASMGASIALPGMAGAALGGPLQPGEGVVVLIQLGGGNDGLNTVAPIDNGTYRSLRRGLALDPATALRIDGGLALHPSLPGIKARYDRGDVAIVQGIGYADSTLSHFDGMAVWMDGSHDLAPGERSLDGWIGRHLDAKGSARSELEAVVFDSSIPLHLIGREAQAVALNAGGDMEFGIANSGRWRRLYNAIDQISAGSSPLGELADQLADNNQDAIAQARRLAPAYEGERIRGSRFEVEMGQTARLINADVGVRVLSVATGGFDNHNGHEYSHAQALARLDAGVERFYAELDPRLAQRVVLVTFSEFGRRPETNGSNGTDHGSASLSFVIGPRVKGGLHGAYPSLTALDNRRNLVPQVDFRSLYASVLDGWLQSDSGEVLGANFETLDLFGADPDATAVAGPAPNPLARHGYLIATSAGGIHNFGKHANFGSPWVNNTVAVRRHPVDDGYWVAGSDGGVFTFGAAAYHGSMGGRGLSSPIVDMAATPDGDGYWLLGEDGGVFSFGSAKFFGSTGNLRLAAPVVAMAAHPGGKGYWFCGSDGGVFTYGKAGFHGSAGNIRLNRPIVSMAAHPSGAGYWLVSDD
ncbi:MAG: DUF1501 domain-containing protein, partial [Actinomycetota bacterium]|nr:DUF1501 domain-containing protein [Actinomycetota bacterium]